MATAQEQVINGIKTRDIRGKAYVEVAERVRIAHTGEHTFEQVGTEQFCLKDRWFVRCTIRVDSKQYIGTAEIKFDAAKNTPDGTNPFECAETSALGRALGFAGIGTVDSIASFDEVYRATAGETKAPVPTLTLNEVKQFAFERGLKQRVDWQRFVADTFGTLLADEAIKGDAAKLTKLYKALEEKQAS